MEFSVLVPCPMALLQLCVGVIVIVGMHHFIQFNLLNYLKSIYNHD